MANTNLDKAALEYAEAMQARDFNEPLCMKDVQADFKAGANWQYEQPITEEQFKQYVVRELDSCGYFMADLDADFIQKINPDWKPYSNKPFGEMLLDFACQYNMEHEGYVSFEVAKLLKEKKFNGLCNAYYDCFTADNFHSGCEPTDFNSIDTKIRNIVSAPTLQMAMKWLRLERGIAIIPIISSVLDSEKFLWDVEIIVAKTNDIYKQGWVYEIYEQACEAAIKYCLTKLI